MKNNKKIYISLLLIGISIFFLWSDKKLLAQYELSSRLKGRILLAVEENGEAYYVSPQDLKKYYLGRPADAFSLMRNLSIGITNADLAKIPAANANFEGQDTDNDGLSDAIEQSLGTDPRNADSDHDGYDDRQEIISGHDPLSSGRLAYSQDLTAKLSGYILLQAEQNGEAWYVNPDNGKRYFLGRPADAFNVMRSLGLGITSANLAMIETFSTDPEFSIKNIIAKYTQPSNEDKKRTYLDPDNKFTLKYPATWNVRKYENAPTLTQFTDSSHDYILEDSGVISVYKLTTQEPRDVDVFRIASKGKSTTLTDTLKTIGEKAAYENSYEHFLAYEKTTTIQISPTEFLQITLATGKNNERKYLGIYNDLIESIEL